MRIIPFRAVLHGVAYKFGLDPDQSNFLTNQAIPIGRSIDQWVQRLYPARDWPEWALTNVFTPVSHIVSWDAFTSDRGESVRIGRVLKVYLVDPSNTSAPVSTRFNELDIGVHVGYDHGSTVWIRYLAPAPHYTAEVWIPDRIYKADDVAYSYTTGEVYRSKVSGNIGHDPSFTFSLPPTQNVPQTPIQLPTEIVVPLSAGNPGVAAQNQIVDVIFINTLLSVGGPIPDPPPNNSRFFVEVLDAAGTLLGNATVTGDGITTLDLVLTALTNQLVSALSTFTSISVDTDAFAIRLEDDSNFRVSQAFWGLFADVNRNVPVRQIQSYIATVGPTDGTKQVIQFPLSQDQVTPGARYTLTFKDLNGDDHIVAYTAGPDDQAVQILSGLISTIQSAATNDLFLQDVSAMLDTVSPSDLFGTSTAISLGATMTLPGSPWWELVPFPLALANQVMRGASADLLKEWGQYDKGTAEEGVVPQEAQITEGTYTTTPNPPLTGQQASLSRYKL